jgi:hypothetical protein
MKTLLFLAHGPLRPLCGLGLPMFDLDWRARKAGRAAVAALRECFT